ncbi:MAG: aminopeptidase, partial [Gammaproteobacteria bacterium]
QWCFLIVGCLNYRGYFSEETANHFAQELQVQDYDVFIGGVAAYSTLGWFDDPVLNTMLRRDSIYLAKVIFHELAHQKIYIKNDTAFNEAFADTVALLGVQRWLEHRGSYNTLHDFSSQQLRESQFVELVLNTRNKLDTLYKSTTSDSVKHLKKIDILDSMRDEYKLIRVNWDDNNAYDDWFSSELNNAKLMAVITYRHLIPGFMKLFTAAGSDIRDFFTQVERLGRCSPDTRRHILETGQTTFDC